jgi:hypothetical protein
MGDLNLSFSGAHRNKYNNNNNDNNNNNNNLELNAGERGASPSSLPASPMIPIPEIVYTSEQEAVISKFVDFIRIQNVNEKPKLTPAEKGILRGVYWLRHFQDKLQRRLKQMGMRKESANLAKNYENILRKTRARSRRQRRKTRKL